MTDRFITGQTFVDRWIVVDGKVFTSCTFERCVLDLRGEASSTLTDCDYADCDFIGIWPPGFGRVPPEPVTPRREPEVVRAVTRQIVAKAAQRFGIETPPAPPTFDDWIERLLKRRERRG